jgi:hypothetical protein
MAPDRASLLQAIAATIADYRAGQVATPTPAHVDRWISQFDASVQLDMLVELNHVLGNTYVSKAEVTKFLTALSTNSNLAGADPSAFWRNVNFLDIQRGGSSQTEMLALFSGVLSASYGFTTAQCGSAGGPFVYLDDAIFTGNRVRGDVIAWLPDAPSAAALHVIVMAFHRGGQWYAGTKIADACKAAGKALNIDWWRGLELEDRKTYVVDADVLRPTSIPADQAVQDYIQPFRYAPTLRTGTRLGQANVFGSDAGRNLLEQELLKAGARIRQMAPYLGQYQRPLGNMLLETLGFGSTLVTFRNCPNNCPLAFWAGDPWYPLFPRRTN